MLPFAQEHGRSAFLLKRAKPYGVHSLFAQDLLAPPRMTGCLGEQEPGRSSPLLGDRIIPTVYRADEYYQHHYGKNPIRHKCYSHGSGRDEYLARKWGKHQIVWR